MSAPDDLIRGNRAAAAVAGCDERTLRTWVAQGRLRKWPDPDHPRGVAYSRADLLAVASRVVEAGGHRADHPPAPPAAPADLAPVLAALRDELAAIRAELAALRAGGPPALPEPRRGWRRWLRRAGG